MWKPLEDLRYRIHHALETGEPIELTHRSNDYEAPVYYEWGWWYAPGQYGLGGDITFDLRRTEHYDSQRTFRYSMDKCTMVSVNFGLVSWCISRQKRGELITPQRVDIWPDTA